MYGVVGLAWGRWDVRCWGAILAATLLLCLRSSSAWRFLTGEEDLMVELRFALRLGSVSNRSIAFETGTLLGVVWLKSSKSKEICVSSRSANRSKTRSIEECDWRRAWDGILGGV